MQSTRKYFPAIVGWLAYLIFVNLLYYLLRLGVYLLGKSFYSELTSWIDALFFIIALYVGFLLSIRWVVFPISAFYKIPVRKPKRWHLFSKWFSFSLTIILFSSPVLVLNSLRVIYPISGQMIRLISFSWEAIVSLFFYYHLVISDFYINEVSIEVHQSNLVRQ